MTSRSLFFLLTDALPKGLSVGVTCSGVDPVGVWPEIGVRWRGEGRPSWAVLNSRPCSVTRDNLLRFSSDQLIEEMGTAGDDDNMVREGLVGGWGLSHVPGGKLGWDSEVRVVAERVRRSKGPRRGDKGFGKGRRGR